MSKSRLNCHTRVQLTIMVEAGVWSGDETFDAIHGQASTQALAMVESVLASAMKERVFSHARVVGRPEVLEVSVVPEKRDR